MTGWHVFRKEPYQLHSVVVLAFFALCGGRSLAVAASAPSGVTGHEIVTLTNLSAERGREFLQRLQLATASKLPGGNALLVTGEASEVQRAVVVLTLVDSRIVFDVQEFGPAVAGQVPSSAQIASIVDGLSIGTFADPPRDKSQTGAIVDVRHGTLVAIAPVFRMQNLKRAVELGAEILKQQASARAAESAPVPRPQAPSKPVEWTTPVESSVSQTVQAPSMLGSSLASEKRAVAAEPEPLAEAGAKPVPTAPADQPPAGDKPAEGPSDTPAATPQPTAENRQETAAPAPAPAPEPVAAQPSPAQPVQTTPSGSTPVTPETTPVAATPAVPRAQAAASPFRADIPNGDQMLDLTLQDRMPVIQLLDLAGKYLGLSYVYNPDDVKGEVSLKLNGDLHGQIRVNQLYPLLEQSLRQLNLITTRHKGNVVSIVPAARVLEIDPPLIEPGTSRIESGDTAVSCRFELKHIETSAAKNLLDSMNLGLNVTAIPEKRMLIVTTYTYRMERIRRLLAMVDQPGEPKTFDFRQLRYTMSKPLVEKVKAMAEQMLESVSVTVAESETSPSLARQPGENDVAYRARLNALRAQQTALRAQQAALRAQSGTETKPSVYLDADERTNRVLMIGTKEQLEVVTTLVDALDMKQQDLRTLQLYRIQHMDAEDVARKLQELGIISRLPDGAGSTRYPSATSRITTPLPGQPRLPTPTTPEAQISPTTEVTEKGLVEEPQVVVVEATNSLLINATDDQHTKIDEIIKKIDEEMDSKEIPYKIYPLENSSPNHLSEVLQSLIQETVEQQKEGGKIEKVVVNKDEKIKIVPDPNTYSLIVYGNKRNQEWISSLITQLDKRRPQVLIDVTLVSITNHDKFDYDLNLLRSSPNLASTSGVTGITGGENTLGKAFQVAGGGLTAFYGDNQIQALLDTIQEKTYGRVLAKPKLLVNDNEQGKLDAKDITYVETTSALPVATGVPGTTGGLVQTSTSFQSYDAGITLDIVPHISEGDLLRLDIKLIRSDFGVLLGTRPPDKKSSEVDTAVTLPNGATVILGGLVKMNQTKGGSKVPLLGDIPLLGGLFRTVHNKEDGEKLYMFVKAEIIRPDETSTHGMKGLETLSERNRQAFEKHELQFQTYQDWPGIKPTRVDPPKVLDAQ